MIDKFLKAKHWQIFVLILGAPVVMAVIMAGVMVKTIHDQNIDNVFNFMYFFIPMMLLYMFSFYAWFWSISVGLQKQIPIEARMNVTRFKLFVFLPLVYVLLILLGTTIIIQAKADPPIWIFLIMFPLHLFSMFCTFYQLYFVAKTIKTAELQRETKFEDYAGEFFLLWFYPVGIWILQPKVNKLAEGIVSKEGVQPINRE